MVRLAPNCLAKTQEVMLEVSEEVTEINKSELRILASFNIEIEVASPLMTLISKWLSAYARLSLSRSIRVISCDS